MSSRADPFTLPEWHALRREASLVSQVIGAGATALGRASYGKSFGEYYTAFFGLSIGIERLAKLILVADHIIEHQGALPDAQTVKAFGHRLEHLIKKSGDIAEKRGIANPHLSPSDPICAAVIDCLDSFAAASKGRYANFETIGNPNFDPSNEPVNKWWEKVVEPILDKHYRGRQAEHRVRHRARVVGKLLSDVSTILFFDENGNQMTDLQVASERSGQTKWAQEYGRFYALAVVRWLSHIFIELVHSAGYGDETPCLFGHHEFFYSYKVDDKTLRTRKVWPLS
ncbi:hypothetical protein [Qipengyuania nanhaisediminis]|uniref:Uncharacterized protein n=1 Tax=Qipengyuania nanhaisediminis TaxID=604088 RepID=A0A1I5LEH0_9SPHN|nr:hypothetical protein [Qipengyuania nanhaisediminis]SFO95617.1 hypothetical protein SAMN04488060_0957 [Qipengyuania nanhaisediminis]